jgi:hypothetical protein
MDNQTFGCHRGEALGRTVYIAVTPSSSDGGIGLVSNECRAEKELDDEMRRLRKELDAVEKEARAWLARA